jgi:hypothetical protein
MVQSRIFIIPEVLEHILHFLLIDKSLYPTLYISRLWYRCGAPILWKRIELKGDNVEDKFRLERFLKLIYGGGRKPIYSSKLAHLKISDYRLSNRKIKSIVRIFPNIIYLDFGGSMESESVGKVLKLIAESYPNLECLNISALRNIFRSKNDKGLTAIANSCHKLECLNISNHTEFSEISICNVIRSCPMFWQLDLSHCKITDVTIEEAVSSCPNLKYLNLRGCENISKEAVDQLVSLNPDIRVENFVDSMDNPAVIERVIELLSRGHTVATRVDSGADHPIIAINRHSPTQSIISTLISRAVNNQNLVQALNQIHWQSNRCSLRNHFNRVVLADQAEWWYSTDLTNPER